MTFTQIVAKTTSRAGHRYCFPARNRLEDMILSIPYTQADCLVEFDLLMINRVITFSYFLSLSLSRGAKMNAWIKDEKKRKKISSIRNSHTRALLFKYSFGFHSSTRMTIIIMIINCIHSSNFFSSSFRENLVSDLDDRKKRRMTFSLNIY